jgi:hypothetical protein
LSDHFLPLLVRGAVLQLKGEDSRIKFGTAYFSARCPSEDSPFMSWLTPTSVEWQNIKGLNVTVHLGGVLPTCAGVEVSQPCASAKLGYPPLFRCVWFGDGGEEVLDPMLARREHEGKGYDGFGVDALYVFLQG